MIHHELKQALQDIAAAMLREAGHEAPADMAIVVEHPASALHGEYSTNLAMKLVRILKRNPLVLANEIKEKLAGNSRLAPWLDKIEVAPPGFVNLHIAWPHWMRLANNRDLSALGGPRQKIMIEHTSINPNKSAHIGHLRNSCIGDTLARLLARLGHEVEVHNYIDDLGNQLADTIVGILRTAVVQEHVRFGDFCWDVYAEINRAYKEHPELVQERAEVLHRLEEGNNNIAWLGLLIAERIVKEHVEDMRQFGIDYDVLVWESSIVREGFWAQTFDKLSKTESFHMETAGKLAGCWVLKQTNDAADATEQSEHQADKVLVRSNGILTYTAKDIAYHMWKFGLLDKSFRYQPFGENLWSTHTQGVERDIGRADAVINVIDHRQEYPQQMVKQALQALGYEAQAGQLRHVSYGVVSLSPATAARLGVDTSEGRTSYPMSGRQGIGIKVADLVSHMETVIDAKRSQHEGLDSRTIAAASIRYYLLKFHLHTEVVFDLDQATEVTGNTGVYLMYAYARASALLEKGRSYANTTSDDESAAEASEDEVFVPANHSNLLGAEGLVPQEYALMKQLAYWPEILEEAMNELAPNVLCTYAYELAMLFNHFYATCTILRADEGLRRFRLWLTEQVRATLHDAYGILGLPAPARM
ncbi:arginine--tRNA ligase [Paenibacillus sacheonensis]|uniref:Arginine--tRNA ligase n=1 Tax=Paenibacillus sacheonensis TaxID=742054 RepID=A0A7X4YMX1_9BACL|nr:arginine--tRNA ligase [Paenibacillus sacheonensis]MBM7563109.1 arginyl-tRNA synthetase [Paenibacillus sacheonensis]NBC68324.1 arginine--tRNA ligase [Paenibacillus sacheonensis]